MSPLRKLMHPERAEKCVFVFENYGLLELKQQAGNSYEDFYAGLLSDEELAAARAHETVLRRGTLIINDAPNEEEDEQEGEEEESDTVL